MPFSRTRFADLYMTVPSSTTSAAIFRYIPALGALRSYRLNDARHDVIAGLTVATVAVPQAMAYALIAGLPPEYGLYTAIVMTTIGALFDSSRQLINGPTNAISIALLSAIGAIPDPEIKLQAAILLAFLVGSIQVIISLLRLGYFTRYIPSPVIGGFTFGACCLPWPQQPPKFSWFLGVFLQLLLVFLMEFVSFFREKLFLKLYKIF